MAVKRDSSWPRRSGSVQRAYRELQRPRGVATRGPRQAVYLSRREAGDGRDAGDELVCNVHNVEWGTDMSKR